MCVCSLGTQAFRVTRTYSNQLGVVSCPVFSHAQLITIRTRNAEGLGSEASVCVFLLICMSGNITNVLRSTVICVLVVSLPRQTHKCCD